MHSCTVKATDYEAFVCGCTKNRIRVIGGFFSHSDKSLQEGAQV